MVFHWLLSLAPDPAMHGYAAALFALLATIPLLIAIIGGLSLHGGTEERIRAWVLMILGLGLATALVLPAGVDGAEGADAAIATQVSMLFAYGYVLADWGRQAMRSSMQPLWAHGAVAACLLASLVLAVFLLI